MTDKAYSIARGVTYFIFLSMILVPRDLGPEINWLYGVLIGLTFGWRLWYEPKPQNKLSRPRTTTSHCAPSRPS